MVTGLCEPFLDQLITDCHLEYHLGGTIDVAVS